MGFFKDELRKFGLLVGGIFAAIGAFILWRNETVTSGVAVFGGIGLSLIGLGLLFPPALRPIHKVWMFLAHILGWINTRLILGAVFYVGFALARLFLLVCRRDPMLRRPDPSADSYWCDARQTDPVSLEHPF